MWWKERRGRDLFRAYELQAIDALRASMSPDAGELLDRHGGKELVQRLYDDAEVNTYPNRRGPQRHDPAIAFPNRSQDLWLATVHLSGPVGAGKVVFNAVGGQLFEVRFNPKPRALGPRDQIASTRATLHADPMVPHAGATARDYLARIDPRLRAELEQAWERPDPSMALAVRDELYSIDLDDGAYLVLAQLEDTSFVVARLDDPGRGVRRFEPDGELIGEYGHLTDEFAERPDG